MEKSRERWLEENEERRMEESEKKKRIGKAEELKKKWELLRECIQITKMNGENWKKRTIEETKRIKEEEKKERPELARSKKMKFVDEYFRLNILKSIS